MSDAAVPGDARPWKGPAEPGRILAIRLQATGDVVITLPYLNDLRARLPDARIDLLTREEAAPIPRSLRLFSEVHAIGGGRSYKRQCLSALLLLPRLRARRYDVVIDLQDSEISRIATRALAPRASSRFDRAGPLPAGERTRIAIDASGLGPVRCDTRLETREADRAESLLRSAGWRSDHDLVGLNPAGAFPSRNWPLPSYVGFAREWQRRSKRPAQFLLLGLPSLGPKAAFLREHLDGSVVDLVGRTGPAEAFAVVQRARLVLSEDSGLMHMAWVSGVPTLALFGSSRGDQARPLGARSLCLDSRDLECGYCMDRECRFGDVRCLTRHSPRAVAERALALVESEAEAEMESRR